MKTHIATFLILLAAATLVGAEALEVVTTLTDYAAIAREIGGDRVHAQSIMSGAADPHHLKPKPSYALILRDADLFVSTGLDLEMWAPVVVNKSGNRDIVDGGSAYVSASHGVKMLQIPASLSRSSGDIHIYGNPHIMTSPINAKVVAANIATGLCKVDPSGCSVYKEGLKDFNKRISAALYGPALIELIGVETLDALAQEGKLVAFLKEQKLFDQLGGWFAKALPMHGANVVCYHKNWIYLTTLFGLNETAYVEPKPGIPPTPRHVSDLVQRIEQEDLQVLLTANYFEQRKPELIAERTGINAVILPLAVGGDKGVDTYFDLVDLWVERLVGAFADDQELSS